MGVPFPQVLTASALNFVISYGVKMVTVSKVGRSSLPWLAMKFDFLIMGAAAIGFFGMYSCWVR